MCRQVVAWKRAPLLGMYAYCDACREQCAQRVAERFSREETLVIETTKVGVSRWILFEPWLEVLCGCTIGIPLLFAFLDGGFGDGFCAGLVLGALLGCTLAIVPCVQGYRQWRHVGSRLPRRVIISSDRIRVERAIGRLDLALRDCIWSRGWSHGDEDLGLLPHVQAVCLDFCMLHIPPRATRPIGVKVYHLVLSTTHSWNTHT